MIWFFFWLVSLYLAFILGWRLKERQDQKIWRAYWEKEQRFYEDGMKWMMDNPDLVKKAKKEVLN